MRRVTWLILPVIALLAACGYKASDGKVIELTYSPEESGYYQTTQCNYNPNTKSTICTPVLQHYHHAECYGVRVEDDNEHRGTWCTDAATWHDLHVGDYFNAKAH